MGFINQDARGALGLGRGVWLPRNLLGAGKEMPFEETVEKQKIQELLTVTLTSSNR